MTSSACGGSWASVAASSAACPPALPAHGRQGHFIPSDDVVAALRAQGIVDRAPSSQRDLAAVQAAFNAWQTQSGRPLCQLSMMLAFTVNH